MIIHVECSPDEALLKKLGFPRKRIKHHGGKSKVFNHMRDNENQVAMLDEDPDSAPHNYEPQLKFQDEKHGIRYLLDPKRNNKVFIIKPRLEDWIIAICKRRKIDMRKDFGLPDKYSELHKLINIRSNAFDKLLEHLLNERNEALLQLQIWLK